MPTITKFYGITIRMFYREHGIPHFHAVYGGKNAVFVIATLEMIEGELPRRAQRMIEEWAKQHQGELTHMWHTQEFHQLPGLE